MRRTAHPPLSSVGQEALASYEHWMREREDLASASIRNYLSDLRHFIAWYEMEREATIHDDASFTPQGVTTPTLTRYRSYLQTVGRQKPASVNRSLLSLKRYFGWVTQHRIIAYEPSVAVKLVGREESVPRHLDDQEEQALMAAVTKAGTLRDRVLIILLLHTGLRAGELCQLRRDQVKLGKWSGFLEITGKRNKYREVPLNVTARKALEEYVPTLSAKSTFLFPSGKTKEALSERALEYIVKKYARMARLPNVSSQDLRHRFGYRMAEAVPLHRLTQIMGHDSLDTTKVYTQETKHDFQEAVETITWT
jgi:integrase/recombinase XerD